MTKLSLAGANAYGADAEAATAAAAATDNGRDVVATFEEETRSYVDDNDNDWRDNRVDDNDDNELCSSSNVHEEPTTHSVDGKEAQAAMVIEASLSQCGNVHVDIDRTLSNTTNRTAIISPEGDLDGEESSIESECAVATGHSCSARWQRRSSTPSRGEGVHRTCVTKRMLRIFAASVIGATLIVSVVVMVFELAVTNDNNHENNAAAEIDWGNKTIGNHDTDDFGKNSSNDFGTHTLALNGSTLFGGNDTNLPQNGSVTAFVSNVPVTYKPGDLTATKHGLLLSTGLEVKIIAKSLERVEFADGTTSKIRFHNRPDAGATFPIPEDDSLYYHRQYPGGWVYVSNAESSWDGGVGSLVFDKSGRLRDYNRVLTGTSWNCGGGKTPWQSWISCEEPLGYNRTGFIYEVDPFGQVPARKTALGESGGSYESFTYDDRDKSKPRFFYTEDHRFGPIRRFTPKYVDWDNPWDMLHQDGDIEYLVLEYFMEDTAQMTKFSGSSKDRGGHFYWTKDKAKGESSASFHFPHTEGIDCDAGQLFFVNKVRKMLFQLDLDSGIWSMTSTQHGAFDGSPDTIARILDDPRDFLYFTEDGGSDAGVHARDIEGNFYVILSSPVYHEETTGLSFSPDGKHMYVAYQKSGLLFDVTRDDGLPFQGRVVDAKYHATETGDP